MHSDCFDALLLDELKNASCAIIFWRRLCALKSLFSCSMLRRTWNDFCHACENENSIKQHYWTLFPHSSVVCLQSFGFSMLVLAQKSLGAWISRQVCMKNWECKTCDENLASVVVPRLSAVVIHLLVHKVRETRTCCQCLVWRKLFNSHSRNMWRSVRKFITPNDMMITFTFGA